MKNQCVFRWSVYSGMGGQFSPAELVNLLRNGVVNLNWNCMLNMTGFYIKWICGFANAKGGSIFIGKNDIGDVVGLKDSKKLLEDIPNKVRNILGILVDVNLHHTDKGEFIEIVVEAQPFPVNYKGQYHYRSGSTKQELTGLALDKFMLQRKGKHWDSVPVPHVSVSDLKKDTFTFFKRKQSKLNALNQTL